MSWFSIFTPKSYIYLRAGYSFKTFRKDLLAGITVGIIALPLAMAFAIASGVSPERGIVTAIIAGFLISLLGGCRAQIGGPTGAFVVIVYGIISRSGYEGLAISTMIAAIILILLALFQLGTWIKYIPHPLVTGFTTGIALIIFSIQIKDFFGLDIGEVPAGFIAQMQAYWQNFSTIDPITFGLSGATLGLILIIRRFFPMIPWGIAAIVFATVLVWLLDLPVATIQSKFGQIPSSLPFPSLPSFSIPAGKIQEIFLDGITIAFLGGIESLLSAVIADGMMGSNHKSNTELLGQGIANFASILFGGIPATGAIARTSANIKTGAQTPVAGMVHALVLFLIIFFLSPLVSQVPLAALSAILMMIAWNMSEVFHFCRLLKSPAGDVAVLLASFLLTVFVDIAIAVSFGMILACLLFMKKMSQFSKITHLFHETPYTETEDPDAIAVKSVPAGTLVYEIQGPFFFGAADMLKDLSAHFQKKGPQVFILRMRYVPMIDASGMYALKEFYRTCAKTGTRLILSGVLGQTEKDLRRFGLTALIGEDFVYPHIDAALAKARSIVET